MKSSKKALIALSFATLFSGAFVHAGFTPAEENCRSSGGQFWILGAGTADDLELCRFGAAAISDLSLYDFTVNGQMSEAVNAYLNATSADPNACDNNGGVARDWTDTNGKKFTICQFGDSSAIEEATLSRGTQSAANTKLTRALNQ